MLPASEAAQRIARLGWWLTAVAIFVSGLMTVLIVAGIRRQRAVDDNADARGVRAIRLGLVLTVAALLTAFLATLVTLRRTVHAPREPSVVVDVIGHQWWWEVRYPGADGDTGVTANEVHIPVGEPVLVRLASTDVIHSFWVPQLAGKTDLVPGQRTETWLQVDRDGAWRGQCAEYCGAQHALMAMTVVAEDRAAFDAWLARQRLPAAAPGDSVSMAGRDAFVLRCGSCHTVRGTEARGVLGPDLTHLASRPTLAAGTLPNTLGNLGGWIANPQGIKPASLMPAVPMTSEEFTALLTWLGSLR